MFRLRLFSEGLIYLILIIYSILVFIPLSILALNSFKDLREIFLRPFSLPSYFRVENYIVAWKQANLTRAYLNSFSVSIVSVLGVLLISSMIAYILARYDFPFRRILYLYIISGLALPARLAIIPIYLLLRDAALLDTRMGLMLVYMATRIPFSVFILKHFMQAVPVEIEDSARIDGASPWKIYSLIMLPLSRSALVVVAIFVFVGIWNDFFFPLILIDSRSKETIPLAISIFFGEYGHQWDLLSTALWLAIFPVIIIFFIMSKQFIRGMTQGAIK